MKSTTKIINIVFFLVLLAGIFHMFWGESVIRAIYNGKSANFLNRLITDQAIFPLEYYLDKLDLLAWETTLGFLVFMVFLYVVKTALKKKYMLAVIINILFLFFFYEGATKYVVNKPQLVKRLPEKLLWHFRQIYGNERKVLAIRENKLYDPYVSYILKSGKFNIKEREFANWYYINSLGVRDDEKSLIKPDIVVLGDSHGMGFGVDQDETFAQMIEASTGFNVLNTAISSFATVREMRLLDRVDVSQLKFLIIQYCSNDIRENLQFLERGTLNIMAPETLKETIKEQKRLQRYYFGKYSFMLFFGFLENIQKWERGVLWKMKPPRYQEKDFEGDEVTAFLNAIHKASRVDLSNVQIIIFAVNAYNESSTEFIRKVNIEKQSSGYPDYIRKLIAVDMSSKLSPDDFFILDDHVNKYGHKKIAQVLVHLINELR